jgi:predicted MFS family arabinose efflux permease
LSFARLCAVVLLPFGMGYFLSYLFRAVNAALAPDIVRELGLGAAALGALTAAYLFSFAAFQPALGLLLDRFGPRRVQAALVATAALGSLLFSMGQGPVSLALARALIGLGFCGGLMASFKAVVLWFPPERVPLGSALVSAFGGLGVLVATRPADMLSQALGWRVVFVILAAVTALAALFIFTAVPERPSRDKPAPHNQQIGDIGRIYRDRVFWRVAPLVCAGAGGYIAIQTLWVGNWLRDVAALTREDAAWLMLVMAGAFSVGTLIQGVAADWLLRRGVGVMATVLASYFVFFLSELGLVLEWKAAAPALWIVFGMTGNVAILVYPVLSQHFGAALAGRSNTSLNLLMFSTAFAVQALIGWVVERWPGAEAGRYDARGYQVAFGALLAAQVLSAAWYFALGKKR